MKPHVCSLDANPPVKRKTTYEELRERVLATGRYSVFEATANLRAAALYTRLARDPELVVTAEEMPWASVRRKG